MHAKQASANFRSVTVIPNTKDTNSQELSVPNMASTESGAAASMKSEKANRESLAKKKSAIRAEFEKTAAELEEIEQLKAEAEDLEDEEMLTEMQAEEQRLQVLACTPKLTFVMVISVGLLTRIWPTTFECR